jgi:hypothetical protein
MAAYLSGVVRRITQLTPISHDEASLPSLYHEAQAILDHLYRAGAVRRGDIDSKQLTTLSKKSPEYQVLVLDTFQDRNLRGIRNMAGLYRLRKLVINYKFPCSLLWSAFLNGVHARKEKTSLVSHYFLIIFTFLSLLHAMQRSSHHIKLK